jgi:hypothetical protein
MQMPDRHGGAMGSARAACEAKSDSMQPKNAMTFFTKFLVLSVGE